MGQAMQVLSISSADKDTIRSKVVALFKDDKIDDAWTNSGEHQICCLPLDTRTDFPESRSGYSNCEVQERTCSLRDARKIFASRIAAVDDEAQKRILYLEAKLSSLEQKYRPGWTDRI